MYLLFVLSLAIVGALADDDCSCTMGDRKQVLHDWQAVWGGENSGKRVAVAKAIFEKVFAMNEDTKALFKRVNVDDMDSAEFSAHCVRVANGLDTAINLGLHTDVLQEQQVHLGKQHAAIDGMKGEYFDLFRDASADVLAQVVPCFNRSAWLRCVSKANDIMKRTMTK